MDSRAAPRAGRREGFLRGLLVGLSVVLFASALGAIELALRYADPGLMVRRRGLHRYDSRLGWAPRPGAQSKVDGIAITLGPLGNRVTPPGPVEGAVRALVVGDSLSFGAGVSDQQTFPFLLGAGASSYAVTNLAVEGYGPGQSLLRLEEALRRSRADVVILGICLGNDVADVASAHHLYDEGLPKPRFVLTPAGLQIEERSLRRGWVRGLVDSSFLLASLAPAAAEGVDSPPESVARRLEALRSAPESAEDTLVAIVRRMRDGVEGQGGRLLVVLFPDARALERSSRRWPRLRDKLQPEVEILDLVPVIAPDREAFALHCLDAIGHLSPRGHEVAAEAIRTRLEQSPAAPRATALSESGS